MGHGAAQQVAFGEAEAGDDRGDLDDLLLVEDDAVGALERRPQVGVRHDRLLAAVAAADERPDHLGLQRAGPKQRDRGDHVVEVALAQPRGEVALARAFELEQADGARLADQLVDGGVVARQLPGRDVLAGAGLDEPHGFGDGAVHAQAEDVHLDEAERLDVVLVELGDDHSLGRPLQRHAVGDGAAREDEAAEVRAQDVGKAREALGQADEALVVRAAELVVGKLGAFGEHLRQAGGAAPGHLFGERVDLVGAKVEGPGDDAHRRGRAHGVDVGHHGHAVVAEALVDVLDDLVAARRLEVDVDVGHFAARRIEEALEEQVVGDGVGVGDAQHVAHDAVAGRAAPRVVDAALAGELDDVAHGQEVLGKAEVLNDPELAVEAVEHLGGDRAVALGGAGEAVLAQQGVGRLAGRQGVGRKEEPAEPQVEVAAGRDAGGVAVGLRIAAEEAPHLAGGLEEELAVAPAERVGQRLVGGLGGEDVVQRRVGRGQVVDVVGGDGGQTELARQEVELLHVAGGVGQLLVDELDEEVAAAEELGVALRGEAGARHVAGGQASAHLAASAGRQGDEVVVVGGERRYAGERRFAAVFEVGGAHDAAELRPALVVAGQQDEVIAGRGELAARRGRGEVGRGDARDAGVISVAGSCYRGAGCGYRRSGYRRRAPAETGPGVGLALREPEYGTRG